MMAQPLSKEIYKKAQKIGVKEIILQFSGGSDEGYLDINIVPSETKISSKVLRNFELEIENWAWDAYEYSGAGDGCDYGDNIIYNIEKKTISLEEWYMQKTYSDAQNISFEDVS